jgi:hypothetical protein
MGQLQLQASAATLLVDIFAWLLALRCSPNGHIYSISISTDKVSPIPILGLTTTLNCPSECLFVLNHPTE